MLHVPIAATSYCKLERPLVSAPKSRYCMELIHTRTKYGYMQAHTINKHNLEYLCPNNMIYGKSSQWTCQNWIRKVMPLE